MEVALMSKNEEFEEVLRFWFSSLPTGDPAAMARQMEWWFCGGADAEIIERFSPLFVRARKGEWTTGRKPTIAARPYHRSRSVLTHDPSRNGSSIRARSQGARARTRRDRSRPLRRAQDTLGENLLFLAPRTFRGARESGTSGQSRRRACQRGAARAP